MSPWTFAHERLRARAFSPRGVSRGGELVGGTALSVSPLWRCQAAPRAALPSASPPAPRFGFVLFLLLLLLPSRVGVRRYLAGIGLAFFLMTSSYFSRASGHLYVFLAEICTEICILCAFFKVVALWEFCV